MGRWMRVNSESIYATSASPFPTQPEFGRVTRKTNRLYLHVFSWPADGNLNIPALNKAVKRAYLLALPKAKLEVSTNNNGLVVKVPAQAPDPIATVVVLETN
jgi:alpha-L-fucosidase